MEQPQQAMQTGGNSTFRAQLFRRATGINHVIVIPGFAMASAYPEKKSFFRKYLLPDILGQNAVLTVKSVPLYYVIFIAI